MKTITKFDFKEIQQNVSNFWNKNSIYSIIKKSLVDKQKFYFLDGPPYTNGKIHLGTAWNKSLKDMFIRFKRMNGFNVWDRAGWDTHGLPTEWAVQKKFALADSKDLKKFGELRFIEECRKFCLENMAEMTQTLKDFGVWMDFEDPYITLSKEYINAEWWFVKKAHEQGRLYEGLRTMTWDVPGATAVAKHELEYKEVEDTAIFVKFKLNDYDNDYLVIWTTTPWTIPFNLAIMVNPDFEYVKVPILNNKTGKEEFWWIAKDLLESFLGSPEGDSHLGLSFANMSKISDTGYYPKANFETKEWVIVETKKGKDLEGWSYTHPFAKDMGFDELKKEYSKLHTVLLSKEYVDTSAGSGLVHCAPGCGPEDYEVGYKNGLPAFNNVSEQGEFENSGQFNGLVAKKDDAKFIEKINAVGNLIHTQSYVHDYPFDQRSKAPVIFRTTKQWFLKVEDIKEDLIKENDEISWRPNAAYNAFNSWLENIRDNSISKQRFWGTPIPIWRNIDDPKDYIVVGSSDELEELSGQKFDDLHKPIVDNVIIKKDGKTYRRIPDVLDVWVDAGVASFACIKYPQNAKSFDELFPADFILEGKDQIRGWFNLLHIVSMISFGKKAFKNCYMHGFINAADGRKMSKSLQNYIVPSEITDKYGVDVARAYFVGCANPGLDANYNNDDVDMRSRNLLVLWNVHNFILDLAKTYNFKFSEVKKEDCDVEELFILSKLNKTIKKVTVAMNDYRLNELYPAVETLFLELSRTYIKLIRDKVTSTKGTLVFSTLMTSFTTILKLLAPVIPYVSEQMYQNLKAFCPDVLSLDSVHMNAWPKSDDDLIDEDVELGFTFAQNMITNGLSAREKARIGLRWPIASMTADLSDKIKEKLIPYLSLIKQQLNIKDFLFGKVPVSYEMKPNYKTMGKVFGTKTGDVLVMLKDKGVEEEVLSALEAGKEKFTVGGFEFTKDLFVLTVIPQEGTTSVLFDDGKLMVDTNLTPELESEGFAREVTRRVQDLRKKSGLEKLDKIKLNLNLGELPESLLDFKDDLLSICGVLEFTTNADHFEIKSQEKVKGKSFSISIEKI